MRKSDRMVLENNRQATSLLKKNFDNLEKELKRQGEEIEHLLGLVEEMQVSRPKGKLRAVQVPPDRAEELRREREEKKRMENTLPG